MRICVQYFDISVSFETGDRTTLLTSVTHAVLIVKIHYVLMRYERFISIESVTYSAHCRAFYDLSDALTTPKYRH